MPLPIVALVGPPNAGKSTLLNKILQERTAVTSDLPGTTRDRQYKKTAWNGKSFLLVDTAGLDLSGNNELETNVQKQIQIALKDANVVVMVADGQQAPESLDRNVLLNFRKLQKPKILAVNKIDSPKNREEKISAYKSFGIKPMLPVSALSGRGVGDLLDAIAQALPENSNNDDATDNPSAIHIAIVGKPNVGKSSLFNKILGTERTVVSAIPGTTRTSIDSEITLNNQTYIFIDTAGLKKKDHRQSTPDIYSGFQTFKSVRRSDITLLIIDASETITVQDQKVAREIFDMQKGCVIVVNKIDKFTAKEKEKFEGRNKQKKGLADNRYQSLQDYISHHFQFLWMCPVFFVSAQTGEGVAEMLKALPPIFQRRQKLIDNQTLSEFLNKILAKNPPKLLRDQKKPKVFSLKQLGESPPTFELLVNHPAAISMQFRKFLENSIIRDLDFWGTPIKLHLKKKIG